MELIHAAGSVRRGVTNAKCISTSKLHIPFCRGSARDIGLDLAVPFDTGSDLLGTKG